VHAVPVNNRANWQLVENLDVQPLPFLHANGGPDQLAAIAIHQTLDPIRGGLEGIHAEHLARALQVDDGSFAMNGGRGPGAEQGEAGCGDQTQTQSLQKGTTTHGGEGSGHGKWAYSC
jgi:hypothetical protein